MIAAPFMAPDAPAPAPVPAFRHTPLGPAAWWRCMVTDPLGALWGTVTGSIQLGSIVTSYEVRLDDGQQLHVWPADVAPAPVPAGRPALRCVQGGKP